MGIAESEGQEHELVACSRARGIHQHGGDDPIHINKGFSFFFPLGMAGGGWSNFEGG